MRSFLPTFFSLFDAMIVARMNSWLYFLVSSLAFFLMVLHNSVYSIRGLLTPFPAISRGFVIRSGMWLVMISSIYVAFYLSELLLLDHVCDVFTHGVGVV